MTYFICLRKPINQMHLPQHQTLQRELQYGEANEDDPGLLVQTVSTHKGKQPLCLVLVVLLDVLSAGVCRQRCCFAAQREKSVPQTTDSQNEFPPGRYLDVGGKCLEINFCAQFTLSDIHSTF